MVKKKGVKRYSQEIKTDIVQQHKKGKSTKALSREYGISRYAIQSWCGLVGKAQEEGVPKRIGRPRKKPPETEVEYRKEIERLKMENELLRSFLQAVGRR